MSLPSSKKLFWLGRLPLMTSLYSADPESPVVPCALTAYVPAPVLTTALYERFSSRGEADFQNKLLSAMRYEFGGHLEKSANERPR